MGDWYSIGVFAGLGVALRGRVRRGVRRSSPRARGTIPGGRGRVLRSASRSPTRTRRLRQGLGGVLGASGRSSSSAARLAVAGRRSRPRCSSSERPSCIAGLAFVPIVWVTSSSWPFPHWACACVGAPASGTRVSARSPGTRACPEKLVLIVIDGLTPADARARGRDRGRARRSRFLMSRGEYRARGDDVPVADARSASRRSRPARTRRPRDPAPRLVPPRRAARSSSTARRSAPSARRARRATIRDVDLQPERASTSRRSAVTVFEALEDAGLVTAAVNMVCYRGPQPSTLPHVPWLTRPAYGPSRFFYFNLFESDATGAPLAVRTRARGLDRRLRGGRSAAGSSPATASTSSSSTSRTTTTPRTRTGPRRRTAALARTRPGDRGAARGRGRAGRVPRALRGAALLRPRADAGRPRGAPRDAFGGLTRSAEATVARRSSS